MSRNLIKSSSPYESSIGFSRAVRVDNHVFVAGTAPINENGETTAINDAAAQFRQCIEIARRALEEAGASLKDVTRTRILLTRITDWSEVGLAHGEYFGDIKPVTTVMEVSRFIDPNWLVEVEVDAILCPSDA